MRKFYVLSAAALAAYILAKLASLARSNAANTRLDGWEATAEARRPDVPESPFTAPVNSL